MNDKKVNRIKLYKIVLATLLLCLVPVLSAKADTASAVSFGTINYELLTLQVFNNNNSIVYYSTDNSNWTTLEGAYDTTAKAYMLDISWISSTAETTLYFKGDTVKTIKTIVLPAQNTSFSVTYDKVEGTFAFDNAEESDTFEWRKNSDYYWRSVSMDEGSSSYEAFMNTVEKFKVTGATIIIRLPQVIGTGVDNVGLRPSAEKSITITQRGTAPSLKVNSSKLTVNTTTAMEYYDASSDLWIECTASMSLEEIVPAVLYENGGIASTITIRKAATSTAPYSKTATLTIPAQKSAPSIGGNTADVTYYYMNSKLMLQFNKASSTDIYEYVIVKKDNELNITTASWKAVKTTGVLTISSTTAPEGCTIYVRKKGTDASTTTNTELVLASACNSFTVSY